MLLFCLFFSVFDTQSIPRLSSLGKEKAQSFRLALGLSDEKEDVETVDGR